MKKAVTLLMFIHTALASQAQSSNPFGLPPYLLGYIRGNVIDSATKEPVFGAQVLLISNGSRIGGKITDVYGNYEIDSIPFGTYTIRVNYTGYPKVEKKIILVKQLNYCSFSLTIPDNLYTHGCFFSRGKDLETDNTSIEIHFQPDIIKKLP